MLKTLSIRNFAVIERLDLELEPGLSVFTGETGAGKSILIEALGFLLGARGSSDWLRGGSAKLEVRGVFDAAGLPPAARAEAGIRGKSFELRRELDAGGRSRAFLDGRPATLASLEALTEHLVDFHGQHEHQTLLKPEIQRELLDEFGGLGELRRKAAAAHRAWTEAKARLQALAISEEERLRRIDLYGFQVREIDEVAPRPGEEEEIEAVLPRLKNAERLLSLATEAHDVLYEGEGSAEESLSKAERSLEEMARLDPALGETLEPLRRAREAVEEISLALGRYREDAGVSPERLDELYGRQERIARLKKKYGATVQEVLEFRERTASDLSALENHVERSREVEAEAARLEKTLRKLCEELHEARGAAAGKLAAKVRSELKDLGMESAKLSVSVEMDEEYLTPSGADRVEFLIAPNPGEPLKPLRSIASGGEMSRVMLAFKTILAREDKVPLLVFDEVDSGVGAGVGRAVGAKLAELGRHRQVFCVTHLPQVACWAGVQYEVLKSVSGGRTFTRVERLAGDARVEALARMLGGKKITDISLRHAKELLRSP